QVRQNSSSRTCNVVVVPVIGLPDSPERLFAVLFEDVPPAATPKSKKDQVVPAHAPRTSARGAGKVEHELQATKEYLQALIGEHQRANDALATANEELVSSNEELQ